MANRQTGSKKLIDKFLKEAKKEIHIDRIILYGSQARSTPKKWSDIDLAVVSEDFENVEPFERLVMLGKISWRAHATAIEAIGYTPEEYNSASRFDFISEIKKTGKVIK